MPDTKRTREYTFTAAVEKLRALDDECNAERETELLKTSDRVNAKYRAKFAAVLARVPEKVRAAVAEEAGVDLNAALDALAAEGPPDDAEPVYTAAGVQEPLSEARAAVGRGR